jgi:hypothetical protein
MKQTVLSVVLAVLVTAGGAEPSRGTDTPPAYAADEAPPRLASGIKAADAAISALQRRLAGRLVEEMKAGGPARAITVCRDEAPGIAAETARTQGVRVGRTSHRLRNAANTAPAWAEPFVAKGAGRKAAGVQHTVVDLGDRVGVLRPIATAGVCLRCHGTAGSLAPEVRGYLETAYPGDRAIGFEEGDLRGFAWAEAPVDAATTPSETPPR